MKAFKKTYRQLKRLNTVRRDFHTAKQQMLSSTEVTEEERAIVAKISLRIHNNDNMYTENKAFEYIYIGLSAYRCIQEALSHPVVNSAPKSILDFPCGYGRVLRFLRVTFPNSEITAAEIDTTALDFCHRTFSVATFLSKPDFRELSPPQQFDLIWCGSLFTHIDQQASRDLLKFFHDHLSPQGVCIFTTHGQLSIDWIQGKKYTYGLTEDAEQAVLQGFEMNGYGYGDYADQSGYGISAVTHQRMRELAQEAGGWHEILFLERGWAQNHDVYAFAM